MADKTTNITEKEEEDQEQAVNPNAEHHDVVVVQEPQEQAIATDPENRIVVAAQEPQVKEPSSSPRNAESSDTEDGEIKDVGGDNENVLTDIDDVASSEEGYYEFSDKEKEAEYKRSGKRKMPSGEGTSTSRKKRKKTYRNQNMAHFPSQPPYPQPLYQNPLLGGQVLTFFPGQNYYRMPQQPLFIAPAPTFPNQALMMQPQYPPVAPFGSFVFGQNFNPQMQPTLSQGFNRGQGGFGRDQHRGRGRGSDHDYGRGRGSDQDRVRGRGSGH